MSPVAVSADRRFHRAHVKPSRRRGPIRNVVMPALKYGISLAIVALLAYQATAVLAQARGLQVDRIVVSGNNRMSNAEVLAALEGMRGENIIWTDLNAWRDRLIDSPWVRDAAFRRSLPATVEVVVSEREPIGIGRINGQLYLVDERGGIIDAYGPHYGELDLPIIDGLASSKKGESEPDVERGELAARLIHALKAKPVVAKRLSQVDVSNLHNAAVIVAGDPALIYVGEERFLQRLESYLGLASALRERVADIDYVDLRFDDRIYVRPTAAARRASAAAGSRQVARTTAPRR